MAVRMLNGHQLRNRSISPRPRMEPKNRLLPQSLINIDEPAKSDSLMNLFEARMKKEENKRLQLRKSKLLSTGSIVDVSYCDMKSDLQEVNWSSLDVSSTAGDRCTTPLLPIGPSSLMFDSSVVFSDSDQEDVKMSNTVQDIIAMLASDAGGSSLGPPMFSSPIVVTDADQEDVKMINMVPDIFGMLASDAGGSKDEASSEDVVAQTTISSDDIDEYLHGLASDAVPTSTSSLRISQPSSLPIHDNSLELGLQPLTVSLVDNARHYTSSCWDLADIENFLKDADPLHVPCSSVVREALDYKPSTLPVFSGPTDAVQPPPLSSECCQYERVVTDAASQAVTLKKDASMQTDPVIVLPFFTHVPVAASGQPQSNADERSGRRARSCNRRRRRQKHSSYDVCMWEVDQIAGSRPDSVQTVKICRRCAHHSDHISMSCRQSVARPRQSAPSRKSSGHLVESSRRQVEKTSSEVRRGPHRTAGSHCHNRGGEVSLSRGRSKQRPLGERSRQKTGMSGSRSRGSSRQVSVNRRSPGSIDHAHVRAVRHSQPREPRETKSRKRPPQYSALNAVDSRLKRQKLERSVVNHQLRYSCSTAVRPSFSPLAPICLPPCLYLNPSFSYNASMLSGLPCFFSPSLFGLMPPAIAGQPWCLPW